MDNPSVIYKTVVPCLMFLPVSPALPASYPAFLDTTAFCSAFVFMVLRSLTNSFSLNCFVFTSIQIAGGVSVSHVRILERS